MNNELQLITQNELCKLLNISLSTLWRWEQQKKGFLKKLRLSRKGNRYLYKDVKNYIENKVKEGY